MKLDFIIAGVQKAGTTALWRFLRQHPEIALSETKELHFFDNESLDWSKPPYQRITIQFDNAARVRIRGEATPIYTYWPPAMERIRSYNANIKLIVILRNPVELAYSQWRMERARGNERLSFAEAIRGGRERVANATQLAGYHRIYSYVERGFYAAQLSRMFSLFPREQVLLLRQPDLKNDHRAVLDQICEFLKIAPFSEYPAAKIVFSHEAVQVPVVDEADAAYLSEMYRSDLETMMREYGLDLFPGPS